MLSLLPERRLGGLRVSALGFGGMVLSPGLYGPVEEPEAVIALESALDAGVTLVDTSDSYGSDGHNERLIGRVVRRRRDEVVVATKFGFKPPPGVGRHEFPVGYAFGKLAVNAEPRFVRGYAEASLARLGLDHIDLWYPHFPDPTVPIEETVGAMADVVAAGLVRHIGLSNVSAEQVERAGKVHPIAAVQVEWSLWHHIHADLLRAAEAAGAGIVAWSPLGAGFLTGTVTDVAPGDYRAQVPRYAGTNLAHNFVRFAPLRAFAADLGLTPTQLALAWLLHQHPDVVPIPGSRSPAHIRENLAAAVVELSGEDLATISELLSGFVPVGASLLERGDEGGAP